MVSNESTCRAHGSIVCFRNFSLRQSFKGNGELCRKWWQMMKRKYKRDCVCALTIQMKMAIVWKTRQGAPSFGKCTNEKPFFFTIENYSNRSNPFVPVIELPTIFVGDFQFFSLSLSLETVRKVLW